MKGHDLTNRVFERLTCIRIVAKCERHNLWLCKCSCGKEVKSTANALLRGKTKSCGCYSAEQTSKRFLKHGGKAKNLKSYSIWKHMRQRCKNPKIKGYKNWGGRGITICERWEDFNNFYQDMGDCPPNFSIERIDVNGNYEPSNCKWIPWKEQWKNKRGKK